MVARLILALLLAAFALPASAPAACHDAPKASGMALAMHDMPIDHAPDRKAPPPHGCVGCVPPSNWIAGRLPAMIVVLPPAPVARVVALDIGGAVAPALRPPRRA